MLKSEYANPLDCFIPHGIKLIGSYKYVLLIDQKGQTIIERIASDSSTIMFTEMTTPVTPQTVADVITAFWAADVTTYAYVYLFQLQ